MARSKRGRGAQQRGSRGGGNGIAIQVINEQRNQKPVSAIPNGGRNHNNRGDQAVSKKNERAFFSKFFGKEPRLLDEYNRRMSKAGPDGYIDWDFLPSVKPNRFNIGQYCKALQFVQSRLESARIDHFDDLDDLRHLSQKVLTAREEALANHRNVCDLWKSISDTIEQKQAEIRFLNARVQTVDQKPQKTKDEKKRGSSGNFFVRLFCCCS